ncbi:C-type lectin domain family 4 member G isoform X2 [Rattus norvegicus]|uniref:C-type lectin domain family 4 member G isoform X2 n=1 Tax=Rattus norvegicus TaxID=10116 RepID=UPI0019171012|nr:C-type lectin domain family 4 member G isoform X2 [Rattus norvegicus]
MNTGGYSKLGGVIEEAPRGQLGRWECYKERLFFLVLAFLVATVLWALILSILLSNASSQLRVLLNHQDLLRTNASKQKVMLSSLKDDVGACRNCCSVMKAQLQTTLAEFKDTQAKVMEQESNLKDLQERVTQDLAKASRDRENIRSELFRALETVKRQNSSCEQCPPSWLPFQGSCYYFSETQAIWDTAQSYCVGQGLPESAYSWPGLLVGSEGRSPPQQDSRLPVGGWSSTHLQPLELWRAQRFQRA